MSTGIAKQTTGRTLFMCCGQWHSARRSNQAPTTLRKREKALSGKQHSCNASDMSGQGPPAAQQIGSKWIQVLHAVPMDVKAPAPWPCRTKRCWPNKSNAPTRQRAKQGVGRGCQGAARMLAAQPQWRFAPRTHAPAARPPVDTRMICPPGSLAVSLRLWHCGRKTHNAAGMGTPVPPYKGSIYPGAA